MMAKEYLLASDFDQTLSFNDSGIILSEIVGIPGFREKVAGLSRTNLIQQGGELAYLLRHDPDYRGVRREHLIEAGKRIRLKQNLPLHVRLLQVGSDRSVYVGDGSSDIHVMLHVNRRDGFTIAASDAKLVAQIARRTIIGDDALSVLVPVLEEIVGMNAARIRSFFEGHGLSI